MVSWRRVDFVRITASKFRENVCRILDDVIATGTPVEVIRKGVVLKIVPEKRVSKLSRLKKRAGFDGDPDDIIGMNWLKEWTNSTSAIQTTWARPGARPSRSTTS